MDQKIKIIVKKKKMSATKNCKLSLIHASHVQNITSYRLKNCMYSPQKIEVIDKKMQAVDQKIKVIAQEIQISYQKMQVIVKKCKSSTKYYKLSTKKLHVMDKKN